MKWLPCIFHILLQIILVCNTIKSVLLVTTSTNDPDHLALLAIKDQIHDDPLGALNSSWNNSVHYCDWYGVKCSRRHRYRVVGLVLENTKLRGTLSPYIGNLSFLRDVTLTMNNFYGLIPQEVGRLSRLKHFWLNNNSFSGPIPTNLSHCSNLLDINLINNKLTGGIPVQLTSLPKLQGLGLGSNELRGSIPSSLGNLSSLLKLSLYESLLRGSIPENICSIRRLEFLNLDGNNLSGTVPSCFYNLTNLGILSLSMNQLKGSLPLDIGFTLPNLKAIYMEDNNFNGHIPLSLLNVSKLQAVSLGKNHFTGDVPRDLGRLHGLRGLYLNGNQLGSKSGDDLSFITSLTNCSFLGILSVSFNSLKGPIPKSIANLSIEITVLNFGSNLIYGSIPDGIANLVNLNAFSFFTNHLSNEIPPFMGMLPNLERVYLHENQFSGEIPDSSSNSTLLSTLSLYSNTLHGKIPLSLENCSNLLYLYLQNNRLSGTIPAQVLNGISPSVVHFYLSNNALSGPLPTEVGTLRSVIVLDVSSNRLFGHVPDTLGNCIMLVELSMKDNLFEGEIPKSLTTLKTSLKKLDLSRNKFSGEIPKYLVNFTFLSSLNLSYNELEGPVPKDGVFSIASAISVDGNKNLCGGTTGLRLRPCHNQKFKKKGKPLAVKVVIPVMVYARISYRELLRATNSFSADNLIGTGSYGTVYKGNLSQDNTIVVVKVLNLQQRGASKSFLSECNTLKNIRHRNLLKIITSCLSVDFQGNEFKALVFEFMANGSLEEWLFSKPDRQHDLRNLNFLQRLNIAIDIASALDYLHNHCEPAVVHCDIKPSNILLDDDMVAHVSDFGLAKMFSDDSDGSSQIQSTSASIKGTVGYAAPEYVLGGNVSVKGDVYSYGILLLEMFTGKRPTDELFQDAHDLHYFAEAALPDQVMKIIDPAMPLEASGVGIHNQSQSHTQGRMPECLASIIRLGVICSAKLPVDRIDIGEAILELFRIKD